MLDDDKRLAAEAAIAEVRDGMVVGLGTGSTAAHAIRALGERVRHHGLKISGVATSNASDSLARHYGIRQHDLMRDSRVDLTIDGVDEVDPRLFAIKGAGGAMLREKCVAASAKRMIVIADSSKTVAQLGATMPVPCETLPFAQAFVGRALTDLGARVLLREKDGTPYRTDQDNLIFDCHFGLIADPAGLAASLSSIPGMVGHGLFITEVAGLYVADNGKAAFAARPDSG
jgi:ribose 5-phosphate isomerase A